ncbi:MAG: metallophosphoesterase, partial [Victivallales bacterium]|nr:metallophosphoesterase [Victivallales bacterium]
IGRNYRAGKEIIKSTLERFNQEKRLDFVCNLGDIVDGRIKEELPEVVEVFKVSKFPVKHTIGNHDMRKQSDEDLQKAFGLKNFNYMFKINGVRFLVIHSLEVSTLRPKGSSEYAEAEAYLQAHSDRKLQKYNGMLSEAGKRWLDEQLTAADAAGEHVIVMTHVPIYDKAASKSCIFWDADEMFNLVDAHPCLKAWLSGHEHKGGLAVRNRVLHKTVKGLCEMKEPTGVIVSVYRDRIELKGVGEETDYTFKF